MQTNELQAATIGNHESAQYQAPVIESVITSEDMEREVAYAGAPLPSICTYDTKGCD